MLSKKTDHFLPLMFYMEIVLVSEVVHVVHNIVYTLNKDLNKILNKILLLARHIYKYVWLFEHGL